ncbi:MAG: hypothetical protein OXH08_13280 [Gammaproteobacteria bacterium]|nr:hypothetical protein [Gammaproteobacteria bacterium]
MTFGPSHYVPVLKVKRGEKGALQGISPILRSQITPLLEIVEWRRSDKKPFLADHLDTAFRDLAKSLQGYPPCFLDGRELAPHGPGAAEEVFARAAGAGIAFIPVTGISNRADVSAALDRIQRGLAIRLTRSDFEAGELSSRLPTFMARHNIGFEDTDLIVDLGPVEDMVTAGVAWFATQFLGDVPHADLWRTLTVSASAFPLSMRIVDRNSHGFAARTEWLAWRDHLRDGGRVQRIPTYSDCAIQHPSGVEGFDPRIMPVSATVRYALADNWLLIKGVSTRLRLPSVQFPRLAKQLVYGHLRRHFRGEAHCEGCASIKAAADGRPRLGSAEVWRRLGTIHHITAVTQTLRSLPAL